MKKLNIGIIGGGKFGTAIGFACSQNPHNITIIDLDQQKINDINNDRINHTVFPGLVLPDNIAASDDLEGNLPKFDLVFIALASNLIRPVLSKVKDKFKKDACLVNLSKGFEPKSLKTASQVIDEVFAGKIKYGAFSGPNFADEIVKKDLTMSLIASKDQLVIDTVIAAINSNFFSIKSTDDVIGTEICGSAKNGLAIASGMLEGLGLGLNARAALLTIGMNEIADLVEAYGGNRNTVLTLSGVGDMILTTTSDLSRNFRFGQLLGKGYSVDEAYEQISTTIEGVGTVKNVHQVGNDHNLDLPVTDNLYNIIYNQMPAGEFAENVLCT